jgi:uncharacterized DUF497 family protein
MQLEWDESKNIKNILKHGFDFVALSLDNPVLEREDDRKDYGEKRYFGIGLIKDTEVAFIFTRRQDKIRIISARRARKDERKEYRSVYP